MCFPIGFLKCLFLQYATHHFRWMCWCRLYWTITFFRIAHIYMLITCIKILPYFPNKKRHLKIAIQIIIPCLWYISVVGNECLVLDWLVGMTTNSTTVFYEFKLMNIRFYYSCGRCERSHFGQIEVSQYLSQFFLLQYFGLTWCHT